ncbi:hypothetical protein CPC08DRAFT_598977, partial [Agrocybe pediades]
SFEDLLQSSSLPAPGPEYYAARRRLWLTPRGNPRPPPESPTRRRLEDLMNLPDAVQSKEIWDNHIQQIWKGISTGGRLKLTLPLNLIIKIMHAAWLRDATWPAGMEVPASDDEQ